MPHLRTDVTVSLATSFLALASIASAQSSTGPQAKPTHTPDKATIAALEKSIPSLMQQAGIPGLSIAIIRDDKTYWLRAIGVKNMQTHEPVTEETVFEAASLSKPVFAYAVLKLVDDGKLDLDAPLSHYLTKPYINGDPRIDKITARYVLSHRAGFPNWRGDGKDLTIRFTPGERFSYSGEGFVYLSTAVEQITGKPLNDFMKETVFGPLNMPHSSYLWRTEYDTQAATGHNEGGGVSEKFKPKEFNAAASLHTTADDYARFVEAVLNGTGLNPRTLKQLETPQIAVDPECTNCTDRVPKELSKTLFWGLGWGIEETKPGETIWHWGDNGSFKCLVMANTKRKDGLVFFTNSENGLSIAPDIVEEAIGGEHPLFTWVKYDHYDSPSMQFSRVAREKGAATAIAQFRTALDRGDIHENSINSVGYALMSQKKMADAIRIFQLNTELYPKSSNVYDSLGEAYMKDGQKEMAIKNYEKSFELDSHNGNAVEMLKKLRAN